jgi:hypothetical protein
MTIKQKGIRVALFKALSWIFSLFFLFTLATLVINLVLTLSTQFQNEAYRTSVVMSLLFSILLLLPCWFLLWIFPNMRIIDQGIEFRAILFRDMVNWNDIAGIKIGSKHGISAILLKKTRPVMFWNRLYSIYIGVLNKPVVLLSLEKTYLELIEKTIQDNLT